MRTVISNRNQLCKFTSNSSSSSSQILAWRTVRLPWKPSMSSFLTWTGSSKMETGEGWSWCLLWQIMKNYSRLDKWRPLSTCFGKSTNSKSSRKYSCPTWSTSHHPWFTSRSSSGTWNIMYSPIRLSFRSACLLFRIWLSSKRLRASNCRQEASLSTFKTSGMSLISCHSLQMQLR